MSKLSEAEWAAAWLAEVKTYSLFKIGDTVDYYGKRCKIIDDSGVDPLTGTNFYLIQVIDDREKGTHTWWTEERELRMWHGVGVTCECGANFVKGSENFHAHWCPAYKDQR